MAQPPVSAGQTFLPAIMNNLISYCQQPSGAQETSKYIIEGNSYLSGCYITCAIPTWSRTSVPVSATVDNADLAPTNCGAPSIGHLTAGGAQIYVQTNAIAADVVCGGNVTFQY